MGVEVAAEPYRPPLTGDDADDMTEIGEAGGEYDDADAAAANVWAASAAAGAPHRVKFPTKL